MQEALLPTLPRKAEVDFRSQYEIWRVEYEKTLPTFVVENIKFAHDPEWRTRFMSLTYVRSGESPIWNAVGTLFWIAQFAPFALTLAK